MSRDKNLEYIKGFSKISISGVCKELGVDRTNVLKGKSSDETTKAVKEKIQEKLKELEE